MTSEFVLPDADDSSRVEFVPASLIPDVVSRPSSLCDSDNDTTVVVDAEIDGPIDVPEDDA
jgi:hypothetical protein